VCVSQVEVERSFEKGIEVPFLYIMAHIYTHLHIPGRGIDIGECVSEIDI